METCLLMPWYQKKSPDNAGTQEKMEYGKDYFISMFLGLALSCFGKLTIN